MGITKRMAKMMNEMTNERRGATVTRRRKSDVKEPANATVRLKNKEGK